MKNYSADEHVNVGSGVDLSIADLARLVCEVVGFTGELHFDASKPDGTPRKLMSGEKLKALGWVAGIELKSGLRTAYQSMLAESRAASA
jgi:GDP-L-fucose synthase